MLQFNGWFTFEQEQLLFMSDLNAYLCGT